MPLIFRLYQRRIVNVNVNIIIAGVLAMLLTIIPVHLTRYLDIHAKWAITTITIVADAVFDVIIYYVLHWLANHLPKRKHAEGNWGVLDLSFIRDASLVQFERALLVPLFYASAFGLQYFLMHDGVGREWATVIGLMSGLLLTRTIHTLWMLRQERRKAARLAAARPTTPTQDAAA